ncbi:DUF1932 domain-containing protein [Nocardioides sp. GY 10127]|uniref:NAD(P)-dependent oxidoreductase n=1 Tax=Nocardioides sp. GY 10127 TaxID=2569762 RepID=UPI0010A88CF4|nr:DUF1932 domain-containing protein [Nocardioides sp. GY 10127]TIC82685.1 NAD(P)-dependent oxidoreductase [Nocardioides sp. GY 10127]
MTHVLLVGLGEVGRVLTEDLTSAGHAVAAHDVGFPDAASRASANARALSLPTDVALAEQVPAADVVVSAVTPSSCVEVARAVAPHLRARTWFLDLSSASPGHKREAAGLVEDAGGRYVEVALMSAVSPRRLGSPFLLGGPHAEDALGLAAGLGMTGAGLADGPLGTAAATKLCRSVVVKGMEAVFTEALLTARRLGVEDAVLASLTNMLPEGDWEALAGYFVERSLRHGTRRSEEMREAAHTVAGAGLEPWMSRACVERQAWAGGRVPAEPGEPLLALLDRVLTDVPAPPSSPLEEHA